MNKKIPMRTCVVSKEKLPKKELIRIVKNKEGQVSVDKSGKMNGKGIYLKIDENVFKEAKSKKILNRCLETEIPESIYEELENMLK